MLCKICKNRKIKRFFINIGFSITRKNKKFVEWLLLRRKGDKMRDFRIKELNDFLEVADTIETQSPEL